MVHERVLSIGYDHPALAGHFPGCPIVPGVVLLNEVFETLRRGSAASLVVTGLPMVKFSSPLRPGEVVIIRVDEEGAGRAGEGERGGDDGGAAAALRRPADGDGHG